jgi:regulator of sigma E protease
VGLKVGDAIVAIDGENVTDWYGVRAVFSSDPADVKEFTVRREGREVTIPFRARVEGDEIRVGFSPFLPARLGRVTKGKPAYEAGIREGAVIRSINDTLITSFRDLQRIVNASPDRPLHFEWSQEGVAYADSITPQPVQTLVAGTTNEFEVVGVIGVEPTYERRRQGPGEAIVGRIVWYLKQLIMRKMGVQTLGGPILIAQMAGEVANVGFDRLLLFLAFFNINLCIFNLLPVLPFDGGHLTILGIEAAAGRPLNKRLRGWLAQGGFVLIILLMVFVVLLDLSRCAGGGPGPF